MALRHRMKARAISSLRRLEPLQRLLPPRLALRARVAIQARLDLLEPELALLPVLVDPERVSIDAGANAGVFTLALSDLCRHVHAYEPIRALAEGLARLRLENVTVHPVALSDTDSTAILRVPVIAGQKRFTRASLVNTTEEYIEQSVQTRTLDSESLEAVGFVKIDVEGHESRLLAGAAGTLARDHPTLLVEIEADRLADTSIDDVFAFILRLGYSGFFYDQGTRRALREFDANTHQQARKGRPGYVNNFVFVPTLREIELPERI